MTAAPEQATVHVEYEPTGQLIGTGSIQDLPAEWRVRVSGRFLQFTHFSDRGRQFVVEAADKHLRGLMVIVGPRDSANAALECARRSFTELKATCLVSSFNAYIMGSVRNKS